MPSQYWYESFQTAIFLINQMPTPILNHKSPFQTLFHHPPDYKFLRTFGLACWPYLRPFNHHKMDLRSKLYVFMGYSPDCKGYHCLHVQLGHVYVSQDVQFNEAHFPFASVQIPTPSQIASSGLHITSWPTSTQLHIPRAMSSPDPSHPESGPPTSAHFSLTPSTSSHSPTQIPKSSTSSPGSSSPHHDCPPSAVPMQNNHPMVT